MMTNTETMLRGLELAALAIKSSSRLDESFIALADDPTGEFTLSVLVALLAIIARIDDELDDRDLPAILDRIRAQTLRVCVDQ